MGKCIDFINSFFNDIFDPLRTQPISLNNIKDEKWQELAMDFKLQIIVHNLLFSGRGGQYTTAGAYTKTIYHW